MVAQSNPGESIKRLTPAHAESIIACFHRVYGDSYANEIYYDRALLTQALTDASIRSIGGFLDGKLVGHMAMTTRDPQAGTAELGNTVVDPDARGTGLAWRIAAALTEWTLECGYTGYVHYPTTDHHIMQRQSVKSGIETGLMMGYIPAETDGQVRESASPKRGAATIVYEQLTQNDPKEGYLPSVYFDRISNMTEACGLSRQWEEGRQPDGKTVVEIYESNRRGLSRIHTKHIGEDFLKTLNAADTRQPCHQLDLLLSDPGIDQAVTNALELGWVFCGWLPGFSSHDILRLQKFDPAQTELNPGVVNPTAIQLLNDIQQGL
ncbi:MAG: GNAT family N-acetyltransferase [Pseudomonadota bacterium]